LALSFNLFLILLALDFLNQKKATPTYLAVALSIGLSFSIGDNKKHNTFWLPELMRDLGGHFFLVQLNDK